MVVNAEITRINRLETNTSRSIEKIRDSQVTTLDFSKSSLDQTTSSLPIILPKKLLSVKESLMESMFHTSVPDGLKGVFFETAKQIPEELLQLLNSSEYKIGFISTNEDAPIPFPVKEFDIDSYKKNIKTIVQDFHNQKRLSIMIKAYTLEETRTIRELAQEHGAKTPEQTKEFAELIFMANADLDSWKIAPSAKDSDALDLEVKKGEDILIPCYHYYKGIRTPSGASNAAYETLTNVAKPGRIGQVNHTGSYIHGKWTGNNNFFAIDIPLGTILFWDAITLPNSKKVNTLSNEDGLSHFYICHEFGHAFEHTLKGSDPLFYNGWWAKVISLYERRCKENEKINHSQPRVPSPRSLKEQSLCKENKEPFLTTYSIENESEFFAEAVAAFFSIKPGIPKRTDTVMDLAKERLTLTKEVLKNKDRELFDLIQEAVDHIQLHSQTIAA